MDRKLSGASHVEGDDIAPEDVRPFVKECCGLFVPFAVFHRRTAFGLPENTG